MKIDPGVCVSLILVVLLILSYAASAQPQLQPPIGTRLHYLAFSARSDVPPPFASVDFVYGPGEGGKHFRWWQLEVRAKTNLDAPPLFVLRALTSADPLAEKQLPIKFARYQLRIPETGESYEYRDCNTGGALLPPWTNFERDFFPHPGRAAGWKDGAAQTCKFLGEPLSFSRKTTSETWQPWDTLKRLDLNREILIGNDRDFKDIEGHHLPPSSPNDYTYTPLTQDDYRTAIASGMNVFPVSAKHEQWVRSEPVFYLREPTGDPALRYPADLYRANYLGPVMFIDEPADFVWDNEAHRYAGRFPSDFSTAIETQTRASFLSTDAYGVWRLDAVLRGLGLNLGDMHVAQCDYPTWDSYAEATYYELKAGIAGLVQEGRYNTGGFDYEVSAATGLKWHSTPAQLLKFQFAMMRGGVRPFGKFWGTSIYGQCDPAIAPLALTTAYDMGARYFWFWTSDHQHHLPWNEQMSLAHMLKGYASKHPRPSIFSPQPKRDAVIAIKNGYLLCLKDFQWKAGNDTERHEAGEKYTRVLTRALTAVRQCFDRGEDFDITINDGHRLEGYRRIIRIDDQSPR